MKKAILTLMFLMLGTTVFAVPTRSMMAARNMLIDTLDAPHYTPEDYVQDGLIHMWDAEFNGGLNVSDNGFLIWKDLYGDVDIYLKPSCVIGEKQISYETNVRLASASDTNELAWGGWTIKDIGKINGQQTVEGVFYFIPGIGGGGVIWFLCPDAGYEIHSRGICGYGRWGNGNYVTCFYKDSLYTTPATISISRKYTNIGNQLFNVFANGKEYRATNSGQFGAKDNKLRVFGSVDLSRGRLAICNTIRIYNRTLTEDEIMHNYAIDKERFGL